MVFIVVTMVFIVVTMINPQRIRTLPEIDGLSKDTVLTSWMAKYDAITKGEIVYLSICMCMYACMCICVSAPRYL